MLLAQKFLLATKIAASTKFAAGTKIPASTKFAAGTKNIAGTKVAAGTNLHIGPRRQLVTCLATDACLTADPGVPTLIAAWSHTFMEIDREIISTVISLSSAISFKDIHFVIYGIISDFIDKGQFQYLTNLKGSQEETYLYTTQFLSQR